MLNVDRSLTTSADNAPSIQFNRTANESKQIDDKQNLTSTQSISDHFYLTPAIQTRSNLSQHHTSNHYRTDAHSIDIDIDCQATDPLLSSYSTNKHNSFFHHNKVNHSIEMSAAVHTNKRVFIYAIGIFVCYFYYGIFQEKITRTHFGPDRELFTCTFTLVLIQCIVNALFAKAMMMTFLKQPRDTTPHRHYAACALTYLTAMVSSNMALQHVNYPTQVIGKSCKPIPVMILGVLIGRKSYSLLKYMFVLLIVIGVGVFMYKDNGIGGKAADAALIGTGELLLILSLSMDGFTGAIQERMKGGFQTKSGHMMFNMNLWSIAYLATASLATNEFGRFIEFIGKFPFVLYYVMAFSVLSALGQMFIFLTVADFGPLPCSIITTTRKFFTVLASVVFFGNALSNRQWFGTVLVFTGLTLDAIYGKKK